MREQLYFQEYISFRHQLAIGKKQLAHPPGVRGAQLVLHFHGFQNDQQVTGLDAVTRLNLPLDDLGLQGGTNFSHGRILRRPLGLIGQAGDITVAAFLLRLGKRKRPMDAKNGRLIHGK